MQNVPDSRNFFEIIEGIYERGMYVEELNTNGSLLNQEAIDMHHRTPMMQKIIELRDKYDLHMKVLRFVSDDVPQADNSFVRE